ncbi:DUF5980 family protein [Micromonospora sp. LOL_021]|uniref:DUF5980 family protein n=1 Tax=Micromonospora sp. LOL_021 TaxID=3345417 RepID=UPI003A880D4C
MALAVATGLALTLAISPSTASAAVGTGAAAPAAGTSQATWHLSDYEQRVCLPAGQSNFTYFIAFVAGSWSSPLHVDMHGLPEGTDWGLPHPIAPGSNGDRYVGMAWVAMTLPPLDFGEYRAEMTLTDGVVTQSMPVLITIQEQWGCSPW